MLSFVPRTPTTYAENEGQINRVRTDLKDALFRRDYAAADSLQRDLDYVLNVRDYCLKQANAHDKNAELNRLEIQRQREEDDLKARKNQKMAALLKAYQQRHNEMEQRHEQELARIDQQYRDPNHGLPRTSPTLNSLLRAESFYAGQKNYRVAFAFRDHIGARTNHEFSFADYRADSEVQSKIDVLAHRHEREKRGFRERLESEKTRLNRETANELLILKHKYGKLRRRVLGIGDLDPLPESAREEGRGVYQTLENGFSPILQSVDTLAYAPSVSAPSLRTAGDTFGAGRSIGVAGAMSARNPRVQRALHKTFKQREQSLPI
jgi:hypothetical protein